MTEDRTVYAQPGETRPPHLIPRDARYAGDPHAAEHQAAADTPVTEEPVVVEEPVVEAPVVPEPTPQVLAQQEPLSQQGQQ